MYTIDSPDDGVSHIKLSEKKAEELVAYLQKEHEQAFQDRSGLEKKWEAWLLQANSRRKRADGKSRDAQIDSSLTRRRLIQHSARMRNPIFQQDQIMVAEPRRASYMEFARSIEDFLDYILDEADLDALCEDWIEQWQVFSLGVVKTPFVRKIKHVKQWTPIDMMMYEQLKEEGVKGLVRRELNDGSVGYYMEEERRIETSVGAKPQVIPVEDFVCPITTSDVDSAEWLSHRLWLTKGLVKARTREGIYNKKDVTGEKITDVLGSPSAERKKLLDYGTALDKKGEPPSSKQYEIFETYLSYDYDGKGYDKEIIVTWDRKSGAVLRIVDNPYHNFCRPFVVHHYKRVHGSLFGIPATYGLEPAHVACAASVQQRLDAASKANEVLTLAPVGSSEELASMTSKDGIRGGWYEVNADPADIKQFSLSQPFTQLDQLEGMFEQHADDLMSMNAYTFGREQIDRPTATGQVTITEESKQPTFTELSRFLRSFSEVVMHMVARYRQFYPEGMTYYLQMLDEEDRLELEQMFLEWPDVAIEEAVILETKVSSSQMSKQLRKQEVVALLDRVPKLYETMMQLAMQASNPQNPGAMMSAKLLGGLQTLVDQFFTEFEVPEKDILNPDLIQEAQVAQQIQGQLQQAAQQTQQMAQQLQAAQQQLAQIQSGGIPGPPMAPQAPGQPPMGGPPGMGGPPQGP